MFGVVEREEGAKIGFNGIADEATSSVRIETNHEEESKVMCIPEGFEALGADLVVSSRVHDDHYQEHEVASDTSGLCVMDLEGTLFSDFLCYKLSMRYQRRGERIRTGSFDINEVYIVRRGVDHSPESH